MRKIRIILMLVAIFSAHQVFADDVANSASGGQPCKAIAKACLDAGFVKEESDSKGIWKDCMKPVILGKTVANVKIDSSVAKACRVNKIDELKTELKEFQKAG